MKIYDISQELFGSYVYPGDPEPISTAVKRISNGDKCNLTALSMCCHNGTHVDAPCHFVDGGKSIEQVELQDYVGYCVVADGTLPADEYIGKLTECDCTKLLIKGDVEITVELAQKIVDAGVKLIGVERATVGNKETGEQIHKMFLSREIVILEGLRLGKANPGRYLLCAQPINLAGADGAPCRAILIDNL